MNQYIITEEELLDTRSYIYHEDEVAFSRIESKVRSCPYQSERDKVLDEIEIPFKELLKAIGTVYKLQMALPGDYNVELGEAIQVCFDKFRFIDGMIEELRRRAHHEPSTRSHLHRLHLQQKWNLHM